MNNSVLLDTSFLISLVDASRENHNKATEFYKYFIDNKIAMVLSAIVTSEFCIKQPITDLPLENFRPLPFNLPDSYHISNLFEDKFKNVDNGISRVSVKDDYKIASQCNFNNITYLLTEDEPLFTLLNSLRSEKNINFKPLLLQEGYEKSFELQIGLFS
jgi:hypothetical protein